MEEQILAARIGDEAETLFFHMSSVEGVRYEDLREGETVTFDVGQGPKGPRAENVKQA
ncbi:cold shock domain-containing protein [Pseudomonas sp. GP01-A4]|uniref:cold-shock protein n=1 Tax=Pseudomonas sp. GP01-A4 TaxID=2070571 RepID=UPI001C482354